jgi:hypothetical protein
MKMTLQQARTIVADPNRPPELLAEAAATIAASSEADEADFTACVRLGGLPSELVRSSMRYNHVVAILEDNDDREAAMKREISKLLHNCIAISFADAHDMIKWIEKNLLRVTLFSLDHDLNEKSAVAAAHDLGTGRDVADFLATLLPTCPVIIHSSNAAAALGMSEQLRLAGWPISRVYPHDDIQWISDDWSQQVKNLSDQRSRLFRQHAGLGRSTHSPLTNPSDTVAASEKAIQIAHAAAAASTHID